MSVERDIYRFSLLYYQLLLYGLVFFFVTFLNINTFSLNVELSVKTDKEGLTFHKASVPEIG